MSKEEVNGIIEVMETIDVKDDEYISLKGALKIGKNTGIINPGSALEEYMNALINSKKFSEMTPDEKADYKKSFEALHSRYIQNMGKAFKVIRPELISTRVLMVYAVSGTYHVILKLLNEAIDFTESTEWESYCSLFPDFESFMKGTQPQQETGTDIALTIDNCRDLIKAAPFAARELEAYKKENDIEAGTVPFKVFFHDILPRCLELAEIRKNPAGYAASKGAIMTIGDRLMILSDPDYQYSFITSTNARHGLRILNDGSDSKERGELAFNINIPFLQGLLKSVYEDTLAGGNGDVTVYWPALAKELGFDATRSTDESGGRQTRQQARKQTLEGFIIEIQKLFAPVPGREGYAQVVNVPWFDPDSEILKFNSPYMRTLIEQNMRRERKALDAGKHSANWHCDLMHATAANERNKAAVEMAQRVLVGIQQRGTTKPESKLHKYKGTRTDNPDVFEWHITCKGLILDCPQIRNQLDRQKSNSGRSQALRRAFTSMYRILKEKTDLFAYYNDLTITEIIPTWTTLNDTGAVIRVQHYGRNPKYTQPQLTLPERPEPTAEDAAPQQ